MGSGETSPTMTKTHRETFAALGPRVDAVLLDTPAGFQENVDIVSARAVEYFAESVVRPVDVVSLNRPGMPTDALAQETAIARVRNADWVFAGPGSPTFALSQWTASVIPSLFQAKLREGGAVVLSSAAACTAGRRCVPVYEVYKVGQDPFWLDGLDLLAAAGLAATVVPHFDNTEGGNHDTRFCYLGERRLRMLEAELSDDEFVLGIDEHTAAVFDFNANTMAVTGNGSVTVRRNGQGRSIATGSVVAIESLATSDVGRMFVSTAPTAEAVVEGVRDDPLAVESRNAATAFSGAIDGADAPAAVAAFLSLDDAIAEWSRDPTSSVERFAALTEASSLRRSFVVRLGALAEQGTRDPRTIVGPFVDAMLAERAEARSAKRFADADRIRDALLAAGLELRDTPNGTEWLLPDQ